MIKLVSVRPAGEQLLQLGFSDGSSASWSAAEIIARNTELTRPLRNSAYFSRVFIEAGALAWPNGLELSASSLHRRLSEAGMLSSRAA